MKLLPLLLLLLTGTAQAAIEDCIEATVRVRAAADGGTGTGCCVNKTDSHLFILTNHHVAGGPGSQVTVEFWHRGFQSNTCTGYVVAAQIDQRIDAALVAVARELVSPVDPPVIPLGEPGMEPKVGDTVVSVGCAAGAWPSAFKGNVKSILGSHQHVYFSPPVANGRSGSALFNEDGSRVVGLIAWRSDAEQAGIAQSLVLLNGLSQTGQGRIARYGAGDATTSVLLAAMQCKREDADCGPYGCTPPGQPAPGQPPLLPRYAPQQDGGNYRGFGFFNLRPGQGGQQPQQPNGGQGGWSQLPGGGGGGALASGCGPECLNRLSSLEQRMGAAESRFARYDAYEDVIRNNWQQLRDSQNEAVQKFRADMEAADAAIKAKQAEDARLAQEAAKGATAIATEALTETSKLKAGMSRYDALPDEFKAIAGRAAEKVVEERVEPRLKSLTDGLPAPAREWLTDNYLTLKDKIAERMGWSDGAVVSSAAGGSLIGGLFSAAFATGIATWFAKRAVAKIAPGAVPVVGPAIVAGSAIKDAIDLVRAVRNMKDDDKPKE